MASSSTLNLPSRTRLVFYRVLYRLDLACLVLAFVSVLSSQSRNSAADHFSKSTSKPALNAVDLAGGLCYVKSWSVTGPFKVTAPASAGSEKLLDRFLSTSILPGEDQWIGGESAEPKGLVWHSIDTASGEATLPQRSRSMRNSNSTTGLHPCISSRD
jgi:hypothetical protein